MLAIEYIVLFPCVWTHTICCLHLQAAEDIGGSYAKYAHGRQECTKGSSTALNKVHATLFSPVQQKAKSMVTPTLKKARRKTTSKAKRQVFAPNVSSIKIAQEIRDKWFTTERPRLISKTEIGLQLYLLSLAPDGQPCALRKRFVQQVVDLSLIHI